MYGSTLFNNISITRVWVRVKFSKELRNTWMAPFNTGGVFQCNDWIDIYLLYQIITVLYYFTLYILILHIAIDGSTARRYTAIVTNERRARLRHSVKFLVRVAFENTVGVVQNSADITAK